MQLLRRPFLFVATGATMLAMASALDNIGAFGNVEVGEQETQLLTKVLADDALYAPTITTRACFVEIESIGSQVVSGTKYRYSVQACMTTTGRSGAGKCADENANCKAEPMVIMVFDQPWTETVQVMSIEKEGDGTEDTPKEDEMATSADGENAGSADASDIPVLVTTTDGSSGSTGVAEVSATEAPAATTEATPSPSSAVPTPAPTSGATTSKTMVCATVLVALGVVQVM